MFALTLLMAIFTLIKMSPVPNQSQNITDLQNKVNMLEAKTLKKINWLENENQRLWNEVSSFDEYCKLSAEGKCGPCKCRDNYKLSQKYYCDCQNLPATRDCKEHFQNGVRINGVYKIHSNNLQNMQVYCDMTTDGGGWTVFQRRRDGSENFYRNWNDYKNGFGEISNEFWLGNENLFFLSLQSLPINSELRIDMKHWNGNKKFAKYKDFQLGSEKTNYIMHVSGYTGDSGDSFLGHNQRPFSTFDRDNDSWHDNCAQKYHGAWWYSACHASNLNGKYFYYKEMTKNQKGNWATGIIWHSSTTHDDSLPFVEMKIRRK